MLRYLVAGCFALSASFAFAGDEEYQVECAGNGNLMRIAHVEDTSDTSGVYRFETEDASGVLSTFNAQSIDYFNLLDALWKKGEINFEGVGSDLNFKLDGAPFAKRGGVLMSTRSTNEPLSCEVKVGLPMVSCLTDVRDDGIQHALQFRHATDLGNTTGYYIARVFRIFGSGASDFETSILGSFSLNGRLVSQAFETGENIQFQYSTGDKVILTDWVSPSEFKGKTDVGGHITPVSCSLN